MPGIYFKEPFEQFTVGMDFTLALPPSASVSSGSITVQDMADGTDQTATIAPGAVNIVGATAQVRIQGGTKGHLYNLRWRVTLNTGELLEEDATLSVQQEGP
jgi:hypothetical protein